MLRGPGGRGGLRHRLRQPGGRPGRARLRRRLAHRGGRRDARWRRAPSSTPTWSSSTCRSGRTGPTAVTELLPRIVVSEPAPGERPAARPGTAAPAAERPRRGLRGARARHPRLPRQERVLRGRHRPLGRDRLLARGDRRGRRARCRTACTASPCRRATRARGRATTPACWPSGSGIDLKVVPDRGGARRLRLHARPGARARALRPDRREPAVAPARRAPHGASPTPRAGSCSPRATRARWPRATPRSTATRPAASR